MDFQFWFLLSLKYLFSKKEKENNCVNLCPIIYYSILIFLLSPPPFNSGIYGTHTHLQTTKAYYYYTSLAVFRDISSRIPFWL